MEIYKTFLILKKAFTITLYFVYFDLDAKTIVKVDILDFTLRLVLFQKGSNSTWYPIIFYFQKLLPAKMNYEIYDKEFLIIVNNL